MKQIWWLSLIALAGCQTPERYAVRSVEVTPIAERMQMLEPLSVESLAFRGESVSSVTLAWNHSPDSSVVGYRIYYGPASGVYTNSAAVGYVTTATFTGLDNGFNYYFAATAYDSVGGESIFSNEISYTPPAPPPDVILEIFAYVFRLRWQCEPLKTNILQVSTNMQVWFDMPGRSFYRTNTQTITVLETNTTPHSFYRVRIQQ